ncbi:MAG: hypothetical protein KatS3mg027_0603 [Bacteroidia bacterium]|nr:MAG: hypothetical protein KatS3mg027_0603 [Bacteroidia bacterium]
MRIQPDEIKIIKTSILKRDKNAKIFLFGSRTKDNKKGGDIDILVLSDTLSFSDLIDIRCDLFKQMEEQKIDVVIAKRLDENPFIKSISKDLIEL